ncbi:MAG: hypothetical protein RLZZ324_553 [Candidatus Parcubacteria bacterium]|jgi:hypothetical protein
MMAMDNGLLTDNAAYEELQSARFDERIPQEKGFGAYFDKELRPRLLADVIERRRVGAIRAGRLRILKFVGALCIAALVIETASLITRLLSGSLSSEQVQTMSPLPLVLPIIVFFVAVVWTYSPTIGSGSVTRDEVMSVLYSRFFGLAYDPDGAYPDAVKAAAPIWPSGDSNGEVSIAGSAGLGRLEGWSVVSFGEKKKLFDGWYYRLTLPFAFNGSTRIIESGWDLRGNKDEVRLESPEFTERFVVTSTDQVEARVILSPDVIEHLTDVSKATKSGAFSVAISGHVCHVLMPDTGDRSDSWTPHRPSTLIDEIHHRFADLAALYTLIQGIDAVSEGEGNRAELRRAQDAAQTLQDPNA